MWFLLIGVLTGFVGYTIYFVIKTLKEKKKIKPSKKGQLIIWKSANSEKK